MPDTQNRPTAPADPAELGAKFDQVLAALDDNINTAEHAAADAVEGLVASIASAPADERAARLAALDHVLAGMAEEARRLRRQGAWEQEDAETWARRAMTEADQGKRDTLTRYAHLRHGKHLERARRLREDAESLERSVAEYRARAEALRGETTG